ncbi:MAG: polymer-forming cytoskeletal protein [Candidatus Aminicenantes bacterium]|nr:polymer-forming cytoskeletal protein [Candidatus Aminicenantes bacterium]
MKKPLALLLLLLAAALAPLAAARRETVIPAGETRRSALNAFKARLEIRGRLEESVFLVGGSLRLDGEVTGDVICIAARVEIGPQAVIGRDLIVIGGHLSRTEGSRIEGELYNIRTQEDLKRIASSLMPFLPETGGISFFKVLKTFLWLVLSLLALAVVPRPLARAAEMLGQAPLRHLLHGALVLLALLVLLIVSLLLSFVIIGIPLLVLLMAAYFLLLIFGRAALFYFIGERFARLLRLRASAVLFIFLGLVLYSLLRFLPWAGPWLLLALDLFALGVAGDFILRRRKVEI